MGGLEGKPEATDSQSNVDAHKPAQAVRLEIPLTLPSEANLREHWRPKAERAKAQRAAIALAMGRRLRALRHPTAKFVITMTRQAPRELDEDNLAGAFKHVKDEVALQLGFKDDRGKRLGWRRAQAKGPVAVVVEVEVLT
jgi:hypothetical protein